MNSNTSALIHDRMSQLRQEELVDKKLNAALDECPVLVQQFLLGFRAHNRIMSQRLYNLPFYKMPGAFAENIRQVDRIYAFLLSDSSLPQANSSSPQSNSSSLPQSDSFRSQNRETCEKLNMLYKEF